MNQFKSLIILSLILLLVFSCSESKKGDEYVDEPEAVTSERIEELREQVEDEPNNLDFRLQLSDAYKDQGRNMEALRTLEGGLNLDPNNADLKYGIAELAIELGDKRKAYSAYKDILEGPDSDRYLNRIAPKFVDTYKVTPILSSQNDEAFPAISSDGTKILYQKYENGNWDIFEYNLVSQQDKKITNNSADEENPVYSPLNDFIAFTSTRDDFREVDYNRKLRDIYIKNMINGLETNLTSNSSNDWKPRFSRDGKFIVFVSERDDLRDLDFTELYSNIYIMEKDGSFQLRLTETEANDGGPVMSGGENSPIYFDSNRNGKFGIFKMNGDGSEQKLVTTNLEYNDVAPDISITGNKIVFFSDRDGNYEIYMMNADGSNQQQLTSNPADDTNPIFSPEASKVYFHSNRSGNYDIFEIDLTSPAATPPVYEVINKIDYALSKMK